MSQGPAQCPVCGSGDRSQRINALLTSNTRYVTRQNNGFGNGNPFNFNRRRYNNYPSTYQTTTVTGIAMRLAPPGSPWPAIDRWFWGTIGISAALGLITNIGSSPIWGMISSALVGAVVGYGIVLFRNWDRFKSVRKQHQGRLVQYGESYYCERDDVCYMPGNYSASPEHYKAWLFQYQ